MLLLAVLPVLAQTSSNVFMHPQPMGMSGYAHAAIGAMLAAVWWVLI